MLDPTNKFTRVADSASAELRTEAAQQTATIDVTYVGFEAYPAAQAAFQHAVDIWSGLLVAPVPITVRAEFAPLGPGMLGSARAGEHAARLSRTLRQRTSGIQSRWQTGPAARIWIQRDSTSPRPSRVA